MVHACGWVRHAQCTIHAIAVLSLDLVVRRAAVLVMTVVAEVCGAEAVEEGDGAAEHALPVDLLLAVLVALLQTRAIGLHLALFASQVLLLRLLFHAQLSLAINHTAKVGHLAVVALVERALMHCKFKEFSLVKVAFLGKSLVFIESLVFSYI